MRLPEPCIPRGDRGEIVRENVRAVRAVALDVAADHSAHAAAGVVADAVTVRPVNRKPVIGPADDGRVRKIRAAALGIIFRGRAVVHMIAELVTERDGLLVRVINARRILVAETVIEIVVLARRCVAMPVVSGLVVRAVDRARAVPRLAVGEIKNGDAVHIQPGVARAGNGFRSRRHAGRARKAVDEMLVRGRELADRALRIQPRPGDITRQIRRAHIHPVRRVKHLRDVRVGRDGLLRPSRRGNASGAIGRGGVSAGVEAGVSREPRGQLRVGEDIRGETKQHGGGDNCFHLLTEEN